MLLQVKYPEAHMFALRARNGLCSQRKQLQKNPCKGKEKKPSRMAKCLEFWSGLNFIFHV